MNKKIISLIIALTIPLTFLVGCNKSDNKQFIMTEDTTALDGSVEYSAKTYKDAFYSTENYSNKNLQKEFEDMVKKITDQDDKEELTKLLNSYSDTKDENLSFIKTCFQKYDAQNEASRNNEMYEISSRLYKATLNATKKYCDINDFYIYYKQELSSSTNTNKDDENFENKVKMTTIKEFTLANIYKNAYDNSFISKIIVSLEDNSDDDMADSNDTDESDNSENNIDTENNTSNTNETSTNSQESTSDKNNTNNDSDNAWSDDSSDDNNSEFVNLTDTVKQQIQDAGTNAANDYISQNIQTSASEYCREIYNELENDNPLGNNKEEGYQCFLNGFKSTLESNNIEFN